jgi:hypothetical protein
LASSLRSAPRRALAAAREAGAANAAARRLRAGAAHLECADTTAHELGRVDKRRRELRGRLDVGGDVHPAARRPLKAAVQV